MQLVFLSAFIIIFLYISYKEVTFHNRLRRLERKLHGLLNSKPSSDVRELPVYSSSTGVLRNG